MTVYKRKHDAIARLIHPSESVLDVGFWGQNVDKDNPAWIHSDLLRRAEKVYGLDIVFDDAQFPPPLYIKGSAENFSLPEKVDVIFAGDLIEHLSNPGLFLECAAKNLKENGRLILSTPNAFNLFVMAEKLVKPEPTVNREHTCYFNQKTLRELLSRYGFTIEEVSYVERIDALYRESPAKKVLNILYWITSFFTPKFLETLLIVARKGTR